jgi:hypothetical protein
VEDSEANSVGKGANEVTGNHELKGISDEKTK